MKSTKMITKIWVTLLITTSLLVVGCGGPGEAVEAPPVKPPDPIAVMEDRIEAERGLRLEAEARADEEAGSRERWELAAICLAIFAIVGFVSGTAIGSRGRKYAERN